MSEKKEGGEDEGGGAEGRDEVGEEKRKNEKNKNMEMKEKKRKDVETMTGRDFLFNYAYPASAPPGRRDSPPPSEN